MKKKNLSGGDGYVINPSIAIAGMPGHTRYSYNLIPVFDGELLQNGSGNNKCECECKKDKNVFDLIKLKGGANIRTISQFGAIQSVSNLLLPLGINKLLSLISLIFLFHFSVKNPKKQSQRGGYAKELEKILAPLGKNNLLVLASLLLLHHFAITTKNEKDYTLYGGSDLTYSLSKILSPLGIDAFGTSAVLLILYQSFISKKTKSNKKTGGNPLRNLIAPLGLNAFIATGLLVIIEKIFKNKILEVKYKDDLNKKMKGGKLVKKNYDKLLDVLSPISFNVFAKESFLNKIAM